jgi:hypothetical protein
VMMQHTVSSRGGLNILCLEGHEVSTRVYGIIWGSQTIDVATAYSFSHEDSSGHWEGNLISHQVFAASFFNGESESRLSRLQKDWIA